jgi:DNA-binding NtrC family response regulator
VTAAPKVFLVVDDNADSRFLLVKTLQRKFPDALIRECQESEPAVAIARTESLAAIVAHRAADLDGISLIRGLRAANADVIIVMVSGLDRTLSAIRAGATCFLNYDEWLRVGSLVTDLLSRSQSAKEQTQSATDDLGAGRATSPAPRKLRPDVEHPSAKPSEPS